MNIVFDYDVPKQMLTTKKKPTPGPVQFIDIR